jgi:hypothetical protein
MLVARLSFFVALCFYRNVYVIKQQLTTKFMFGHPLFTQIIETIKSITASVHLGAFGLECRKRVYLRGAAPWLATMTREIIRLE